MAVRTTAQAVIELLDPDGSEGLQEDFDDGIRSFDSSIETANAIINQVCLNSGYTEEYLELIERWLSAHFTTIPTPKTKQEAAKGLTETYEGQTKYGFLFTRYGQQAVLLDYKGNLASLDVGDQGKKRVKVRMHYVGGEEPYNKNLVGDE